MNNTEEAYLMLLIRMEYIKAENRVGPRALIR